MKKFKIILPVCLFIGLVSICLSCEEDLLETCETFDETEECLSEIDFCVSSTESYYSYNGTKYACESVDNCESAIGEVYDNLECEIASAENSLELMKLRTSELVAVMRARL